LRWVNFLGNFCARGEIELSKIAAGEIGAWLAELVI
jgi:hypothetical protein